MKDPDQVMKDEAEKFYNSAHPDNRTYWMIPSFAAGWRACKSKDPDVKALVAAAEKIVPKDASLIEGSFQYDLAKALAAYRAGGDK